MIGNPTMRYLFFPLLLLLSQALLSQHIFFSKADAIWRSTLDGKNQELVVPREVITKFGLSHPNVSQNGTSIAFTHSLPNGDRVMGFFSIGTGKFHVLDQIPGSNAVGPKWAPGDSLVAFHVTSNTENFAWEIGAISTSNSGFRLLTQAHKSSNGIRSSNELFGFDWLPYDHVLVGFRLSWDADAALIIKWISADGRILDSLRMPFTNASGQAYSSPSPSGFHVGPLGDKFLFDDISLDEEPVLLVLDLPSRRLIQLETPNLAPLQAAWFPSGSKVVFTAIDRMLHSLDDHGPESIPSIYSIDLNTGHIEKLVHNASAPCISLQ